MIGLDSGFFVELLKGNQQTERIWNDILDGQGSVVSCISLFELKRLGLKGLIDISTIDTINEAIMNICNIAWLDNVTVVNTAANFSHGLGIHMADALILSGFIKYGVTKIYTTDQHISLYKKKGVRVIMLI